MERVRKCGGGREKADDQESKTLNSQHNLETDSDGEREREAMSGQWMMVVGGNSHAALCHSFAVVFSVAYL